MASSQGGYIMVPQWTGNTIPSRQLIANPTPNTQYLYQFLNKGQPKALGAAQLVLALLHISLGTALLHVTGGMTRSTISGICFWGAVFYIISGSLSIAVERKPSHSLVQGYLAMNIISSLISFLALIMFIIDVCVQSYHYSYSYGDRYEYTYLNRGATAILSFLIISTLLLFGVCVSLSAFGCQYICCQSNITPQVYVVTSDHASSGLDFNTYPHQVSPNNSSMANTNFGMPMMSVNTPPFASASAPSTTEYVPAPPYTAASGYQNFNQINKI
uniref:Uncharacterized protein n=1 Tax=Leptobrachium leishanense TaxID=445787 RepID=A0A8C5QLP1_9ANUR